MVLNVVFVSLTLFHVRKIAAELWCDRICCFAINGNKTVFGLISILVVIPELLAHIFVVFPVGINLTTKRDLIVALVSLNKRIHSRARLALAVAEALEQACTGEYRVVRCAGKIDKVECRRHLVGRAANAKLAEKRRRRLSTVCVPRPRGRNILRVQVHVRLHLIDEQRSVGGCIGHAIDRQTIERKPIDRNLLNRSRRPVNIAAHQSTRYGAS
ncbi:unknown [Eggerthella sp. CAG:368]|nr:unknown [Eggerthella sp. CAG:368]